MFETVFNFIRDIYPNRTTIPLHEPRFSGNEQKYVAEAINSTFVSSVGPFVTHFEEMIKAYTGARYAIAAVNGTSALHIALLLGGVKPETEVLTQALTFVATCNAIKYCGADPVFVDSDRNSLGMSAEKLHHFIKNNCTRNSQGTCINIRTGKKIAACVPMHVFGHPVEIEQIRVVCDEAGISLVEDAAEALGSFVHDQHVGFSGQIGVLSFNGNKTITTGGGGMILTNDDAIGAKAKHITTTAKVPHPWDFYHDEVGYNYRLPNINAALGCAQMEQLPGFLEGKRALAEKYHRILNPLGVRTVKEPAGCRSNYWLNAIMLNGVTERDRFLKKSMDAGIVTRPLWRLMTDLPMFNHCQHDGLETARWLQERIVNIPSSVPVTT